ncbi:bifunctional cytidylyltransferase/SDR family oxidoreductase [Shimia sp.]|uniref:bifunctional cytidylyltransferase/SDR family oxidoreductase n=1 Tax=unclassified Shimia TaxID=2630038 RepID=UPI0025E2B255|nr:bifunctional cytidylyltransferase/SDR family oxidoreductase [Shimia sp.]MCH2067016.1 bifunctional cytidylyltransferase/SDR family oxidoreductase [Shimia sp.]
MSESAFIILAGGSGTRFRSEKPKQLAMLAGKTILQHTLENVAACENVKQIILVSRGTILDEAKKIVSDIAHPSIKIVEGGSNRLESTRAGLQAVEGPAETKVLVHDGVRPFIKHDVINACYSGLDIYDAVDVVIPSADTLVEVDPGAIDLIGRIPRREAFRRGQTPQGFWLGKLRDVIDEVPDLAAATFTDDCGMYLAARPQAKIGLIDGDESNIKITHPIDLFMAEQLIMTGQTGAQARASNVDVSAMNIVIFGASSGLGEDAKIYLENLGATVHGASRSAGCDISRADDVAATLEAAAAKGPIDAVINFAGVLHIGKLAEIDPNDLERVVQTNYMGALNIARLSYDFLKASKGQLMLVSSSSYYRGRKDYAVYSSSKAAVVNLTQALCEEWAPDDVRVNCIVPRRANTPMRHAAFPGEDPSTLLQPKEVSLQVLKLLKSPDSGIINHVY